VRYSTPALPRVTPTALLRLTIRNAAGQTALLIAAEQGHAECCRLLSDGGANLEATDAALDVLDTDGVAKVGRTALLLACWKGRPEHTAVARVLVERGADVRARGPWPGESCLHHAASSGSAELVAAVLLPRYVTQAEEGAIDEVLLGLRDEQRQSALHKCALNTSGSLLLVP